MNQKEKLLEEENHKLGEDKQKKKRQEHCCEFKKGIEDCLFSKTLQKH